MALLVRSRQYSSSDQGSRDTEDGFSFLTGYLPDRRDYLPMYAFLWWWDEGKGREREVINCLYILAPCKVIFI